MSGQLAAGHPAAVIVGVDGTVEGWPAADPMLGAFDKPERHEQEVPIVDGDLLILYTDGVIDAPREHDRFGVERAASTALRQCGALTRCRHRRTRRRARRFRGRARQGRCSPAIGASTQGASRC